MTRNDDNLFMCVGISSPCVDNQNFSWLGSHSAASEQECLRCVRRLIKIGFMGPLDFNGLNR